MPSYLDKIVDYKRQELESAQRQRSLQDLRSAAADVEVARDFRGALLAGAESVGCAIIAEAKKASPSKGLLRPDFDAVKLASVYEDNGASAVSVLSDEHFFQGSLDYVTQVKQAVSLPVLRKDFTLDEYHIYEARAAQADAVLLIASILDEGQLSEYRHMIDELGMTTLIELHDEADWDKTMARQQTADLGHCLLGINNRNLKTFETDLATSEQLKVKINSDLPVVAESGIHQRSDIERLQQSGINLFLIGESLLVAQNVGGKLKGLLGL